MPHDSYVVLGACDSVILHGVRVTVCHIACHIQLCCTACVRQCVSYCTRCVRQACYIALGACDSEKSEMSSQFNIVNVNERDGSSDDAYWSNYHHIISTDKDQVWDGLLYTLNKYLYVLYTSLSTLNQLSIMSDTNHRVRSTYSQNSV